MHGEVHSEELAREVAREYADEECVGELGDVTDVTRDESSWILQFRTHTFSDEYHHEIRLNDVGNVFVHERDSRFE